MRSFASIMTSSSGLATPVSSAALQTARSSTRGLPQSAGARREPSQQIGGIAIQKAPTGFAQCRNSGGGYLGRDSEAIAHSVLRKRTRAAIVATARPVYTSDAVG
jgi:hypothetical protein